MFLPQRLTPVIHRFDLRELRHLGRATESSSRRGSQGRRRNPSPERCRLSSSRSRIFNVSKLNVMYKVMEFSSEGMGTNFQRREQMHARRVELYLTRKKDYKVGSLRLGE